MFDTHFWQVLTKAISFLLFSATVYFAGGPRGQIRSQPNAQLDEEEVLEIWITLARRKREKMTTKIIEEKMAASFLYQEESTFHNFLAQTNHLTKQT